MTGTVTKGKALREDLDLYDGLSLAGSRADSSGGTFTGLRVNDDVDVLMVFGSGSARTVSTINAATAALGSANVGLRFAPGTWTIDSNVTLASNFTIIVPAGCVFAVSSGITLAIEGVLLRAHGTYSSGSGTVTVNGTDVLASQSIYADYAADTGSADTYVIAPTPAIASYTAGQRFRFKAGNTNTGASTLNVSSLGAKTIKKERTTDLAAGDIVADDIITVHYDGTNFQIQPTIALIESSTDHINDVFTTRGDLVRAGASGVAERVALGTTGQVATSDGTDAVWSDQWGWEFVADLVASGESLIEFFHDGIDNAGADFVDGYEYKVDMDWVYGSAQTSYSMQLYEGGSYRTLTNGYFYSSQRIIGATDNNLNSNATNVFLGVGGNVLSQGMQSRMEFRNLASTAYSSHGIAESFGVDGSGGQNMQNFWNVATSSLLNAATKFKIFPSTGTITAGKFRLYRRKVT